MNTPTVLGGVIVIGDESGDEADLMSEQEAAQAPGTSASFVSDTPSSLRQRTKNLRKKKTKASQMGEREKAFKEALATIEQEQEQ